MTDEKIRQRFHLAADECFSGVVKMPSQRQAVLSRLKSEARPAVRRKAAFVPVLAIMLILTLGCAAAAGFGVFGWFRASKVDETSYERLAHLESVATPVGETFRLSVPALKTEMNTDTVRDQLLAAQFEQTYDLTIDQLYCDGRKLYYAYTFKANSPRIEMFEGKPTGFEPWSWAYPGDKFEDVLSTHLGEAQDQAVADWLNSHESAYVVQNNAYVGDGAELPDGTELYPVDSGAVLTDEATMTSYYEVALPEDYVAGETLDFELTVMTSTSVYYQDATGVYETTLYNRETLITVPMSVPVTPATKLTGMGTADGYTAMAELYVSEVDVSGTVKIAAPEDYRPEGYDLVADGVTMPGLEWYSRFDGDVHTLTVRFDLPASVEDMSLVPQDPAYAHESIELAEEKEDEP